MRQACAWVVVVGLVTSVVAAEPDAAVKKDLEALQGAWSVQTIEYNGKEIQNKYKLSFTFKGDTMSVEGDGKVRKEYGKLILKLDPSTTPKCVDVTVGGGVQKDAVMEGIYALKGDELQLCIKVFGNKDRPSEFKSPEGESIALLTLKRQKQ